MSTWKDKALFTPGPLSTSQTVKLAMLHDLGSRDAQFIEKVADIRRRLVILGQASEETHTAVIMQGSGTFGVESVISSCIPFGGKLLVLVNGAYGERMVKMAETHRIPVVVQQCPENQIPDIHLLEEILTNDQQITHVAVVHCETTTGIINPIKAIGEVVKRHKCVYIVDAMSSFGAYEIPVDSWKIDYLVSSSNKCIEGVPGFSFILAKKEPFLATKGFARSLALDLYSQWDGLEKSGQFRFTPPVQVLMAFHQALLELEEEGGVQGRGERYKSNYEMTVSGMEETGFVPYLEKENRGFIITSFRYPIHPNFDFNIFYRKLSDRGCVIYPGKLSQADCFRVGHIGRLDQSDVFLLLSAVKEVLSEMKIQLETDGSHTD